MIGRTKYLLMVALAFGAACGQAPVPAKERAARPAGRALKFRVLPTPVESRSRALAFSRDGRTLLYTTETFSKVSQKTRSSMVLRDVRSGRVLKSWPVSEFKVPEAAAMISGTLWMGYGRGFGGELQEWSARTGRLRRVLTRGSQLDDSPLSLGAVAALAASPDGNTLIAGVQGDSESSPFGWGKALLIDGRTGRAIRRLRGPEYSVDAVAFSSSGRTVAYCDGRGDIRLCRARSSVFLHRLSCRSSPPRALAFRGRDELVSVSGDGSIRLWNARTGRLKRTLSTRLPAAEDTNIILSPNGHAIFTGSQYNPSTGKNIPARIYALP